LYKKKESFEFLFEICFQIFCCHGGLSPDLQSMEQIRRIMRPTDVPDTGKSCPRKTIPFPVGKLKTQKQSSRYLRSKTLKLTVGKQCVYRKLKETSDFIATT
jgi:hypothetical protein